jgi:hypothetical protein
MDSRDGYSKAVRLYFAVGFRPFMQGSGFRTNETRKVLFQTKYIDVFSQEAMLHLSSRPYMLYPRFLDTSSAPLRIITASSSCLDKVMRETGTEILIAATIFPVWL